MTTADSTRTKPKLYVITVSTRPGRAGVPLSTWIFELAKMIETLQKWVTTLAPMRA